MNAVDNKPDYKKIYSIVKGMFGRTRHFKHGPFDETYYTMRVYESAKEIMKHLGKKMNKQAVLVACILHDVGKTKLKTSKVFHKALFTDPGAKKSRAEWMRHAMLGGPIARKILKRFGHSEDFIGRVCYLIENHDKRPAKDKCIELQVLQDADLLADIGFAGFIRPFLFCGKFCHQSVIGSIRFLKTEDRTHKGEKINLAITKKLAKEKLRLQHWLTEEITKEINSDILF